MFDVRSYLAKLIKSLPAIPDEVERPVIVRKIPAKTPPKTSKEKRIKISRREKEALNLVLEKYESNPIISPRKEIAWDAWQTFNPGAVILGDKIHFLYRAIGNDGLSRLGYATSLDGRDIDERPPYPAYEHPLVAGKFNRYSFASGGGWGGCEDPRAVYLEDDKRIYMTYTACDDGLRVAITSISIKDFLAKKWNWKQPSLISPPGEIHKNWVIFPRKIGGKYAILHSIAPEIQIEYLNSLDFDDDAHINSSYKKEHRKDVWDSWLRGAGPPPIETKYGWLLFYHATDEKDPAKYKIGAMLLDKNNPTKILAKSNVPVLEPDEYYENNGYKAGVVYASGAVVKGDTLFLYYGAADNYTCVTSANLDDFIRALKKHKKPKMQKRILRKKKKLKNKNLAFGENLEK